MSEQGVPQEPSSFTFPNISVEALAFGALGLSCAVILLLRQRNNALRQELAQVQANYKGMVEVHNGLLVRKPCNCDEKNEAAPRQPVQYETVPQSVGLPPDLAPLPDMGGGAQAPGAAQLPPDIAPLPDMSSNGTS